MFNIPMSRRIILYFLSLGIFAMLSAAIMNTINMPSLVTVHSVNTNTADMQERALTNEIGSIMQGLQENPNDYIGLIRLSDLLVRDEQWEAAEPFLRRAIELDNSQAYPYFLLGVSLHRLERYAESAELFEQVVSINNDPVARYSLGILYLHHLNQPTKGIGHLMIAWGDPLLDENLKHAVEAELRALEENASSVE